MLWNRGRQGGVLKHMGNAQILIFLAVRVLISLSFWAVKESLILNMHEMIQMAHVVACTIVFILLCDQGWQELLLKFFKNDDF